MVCGLIASQPAQAAGFDPAKQRAILLFLLALALQSFNLLEKFGKCNAVHELIPLLDQLP